MKDHSYLVFFMLITVCCSCQEVKVETNESISKKCDKYQFLRIDDTLIHHNYLNISNIFLVKSFEYGHYPDLNVFANFNMPVLDSYKDPLELPKFDFIRREEMNGAISIVVDTSNFSFLPLKDQSLTREYCLAGRDIYFKNLTSEKYYLLDRFNHIKLMMEAKDENGNWMDVHDIRAVGCGLENSVSKNALLKVLAPNTYLKSCFLLENGEFETECRLKYNYYNSLDSLFIRSSQDSGYYVPMVGIEELNNPVYSNTFKQKISKSRLKKAKRVF